MDGGRDHWHTLRLRPQSGPVGAQKNKSRRISAARCWRATATARRRATAGRSEGSRGDEPAQIPRAAIHAAHRVSSRLHTRSDPATAVNVRAGKPALTSFLLAGRRTKGVSAMAGEAGPTHPRPKGRQSGKARGAPCISPVAQNKKKESGLRPALIQSSKNPYNLLLP